ncbi:MAG: AAA family ATPase [Acidobacteriota bacterium]
MKLLSATIRNYRIHRDCNIEFDQARTLIGGPNETGKSTLIEAIHRGLFLKSTVTGEAQKSMVSTLHSGHPEIEIRFLAQKSEYFLFKCFSGANGITRLVGTGGQTWLGDEAESRLAGLLGVEELGGGRGIMNRLPQQWTHLWVWQGMSGDDPSEHTASQQAGLLQQLQQAGGAVAMQSELDEKVASRFAQARDQIFVRSRKAKAGSDLEQAETEVKLAETVRTNSAERVDRLRQAVQDVENALSTIKRVEGDLEKLYQLKKEADEKIKQAEELQRIEKEQALKLQEAESKLTDLEKTEIQIDQLRRSVESLRETLEPKQKEERQLQSALKDIRIEINNVEGNYEAALKKTRENRLRRELAAAWVHSFEKKTRCEGLRKRMERVESLENEIEGLHGQLARLAPVSQEDLEVLRDLENEAEKADAALKAMATEIEVVEADHPVRIGDNSLSRGEKQTVIETTELKVGDSTCLRIHPGGGRSLNEAREKLHTLRRDLQRSLDGYGLESVEMASHVVTQRENLRSIKGKAEAALQEQDAEDLLRNLNRAKEELAAAEAEVERRSSQVEDPELPLLLEEAIAWRDKEDNTLQSFESSETNLKASKEALKKELDKTAIRLEALSGSIIEESNDLKGNVAKLELLFSNHGDDDIRAKKIEEARKEKKGKESGLSEVRAKLEVLHPDSLVSDRERLERALNETDRQRQEAQSSLDGGKALLRSDGTTDPHAELARADGSLQSAVEHLQAVSRKARAIALIDDLFQQEQRVLADQFSQPLAGTINGYLQCLFGPEAEAVVTFEDNAFKHIQLVRSAREGAVSFDSLSGGTREQVAAAVRLAIAELLAADHDGSLPIVFDDAFAYSDPERVTTLQRMLDLGASRGLQIIVLTCNPSDYASLGARQVILS